MKSESVTFTLLTVGSDDPVAAGCLRLESTEEPFNFCLRWDTRPKLCLDLPAELYETQKPTIKEIKHLKNDILREYAYIMWRALYGRQDSVPSVVLSANLKVLRLGCVFTYESAAKRLNVRASTVRDMENRDFDFEADIYKYVSPTDSLLFRAAAVYHVPKSAVWELSSPHFFLRNRIRCCSYDFGNSPLCTKLYPFRRKSLAT